jgi:hypothetical protein
MQLLNRVLSVAVLVGGSLCGALVGSPELASALTYSTSLDQSACVQRDALSIRDFTYGIYNASTTTTSNVDCAWNDMWSSPAVSATQITVSGWDGSTNSETQVRACSHDQSSTTWWCDTIGHSGVSYQGAFSGTTFHPGLWYWQNTPYSTWLHTVTINLGTEVNNGVQVFWGYSGLGTFTVPTS